MRRRQWHSISTTSLRFRMNRSLPVRKAVHHLGARLRAIATHPYGIRYGRCSPV